MKTISIPVVAIGLITTILIAYGGMKVTVTATEKKVNQLESKVEETKEELTDNEKIDVEQSVLLKEIYKSVDKLNQKLDKELSD